MKSITLLQFLQVTDWHSVVTLKVFEKGTEIYENPLFVATCKNDCSYGEDFFKDFSEYFENEVLVFRLDTIIRNHVEVIVLV